MKRLVLALAVGLVSCKGDAAKPDPELPKVSSPSDVDDAHGKLVDPAIARDAVIVEPGDPSKGAAEPLVVIVEWSDFQCPYCGGFATALDELAAAYPDDVRIVFKQFPLPMHPDAELGARATLAAHAQGRFWAMHDLLFRDRTKMSRDDVVSHAKDLGLDIPKFETALDDGSTGGRVAADKRAGAALGIRGTPSFFVNGRPFSGALPPQELRRVIDDERALGQSIVAAGSTRGDVYGRIIRAAQSGATPSLPEAPQ